MTTHDMQPETGTQPDTRMQPEAGMRPESVDPAMRDDRMGTSDPTMQQARAPQHESLTTHDMPEAGMQPEVPTEAPLETVDTTSQFEPPAQTADTTAAAGSDDSSVQMLFADGELNEMRSRWTEVQSAFVDDPRDCVQKADGLVADVVDKLTAGFSGARAHLEEQWARGEEASTEDLRIALKRYREFFERLLAV